MAHAQRCAHALGSSDPNPFLFPLAGERIRAGRWGPDRKAMAEGAIDDFSPPVDALPPLSTTRRQLFLPQGEVGSSNPHPMAANAHAVRVGFIGERSKVSENFERLAPASHRTPHRGPDVINVKEFMSDPRRMYGPRIEVAFLHDLGRSRVESAHMVEELVHSLPQQPAKRSANRLTCDSPDPFPEPFVGLVTDFRWNPMDSEDERERESIYDRYVRSSFGGIESSFRVMISRNWPCMMPDPVKRRSEVRSRDALLSWQEALERDKCMSRR
ncbi:hypothetical protein AXG93_1504s1350 [Marchantia polymorpha subsp. ruderalis]|uniref:Uncharacterized protein n=1 Tax=Marchantia polymorpha subsp. ruderalis TaxID=1480154 RepID=A0A176VQT1_MARPO|nr:hypothetical protein AXG93_1504s1350 [Marchantia polymorpha subsp. ruderalis]